MTTALVILLLVVVLASRSRGSGARGGCIINDLPPVPRPVLSFVPLETDAPRCSARDMIGVRERLCDRPLPCAYHPTAKE